MTESLRSRIEEILVGFHNINHDKRVALSQILKEIEWIVPEKHLYANGDEAMGWNECREEILKSLRQP